MNVLEIRNLAKRFGKQQVIDGLDLVVPEGSVFGFIGRNGSGKTTTMKMVLGLLRPDAGRSPFVVSGFALARRQRIVSSAICRMCRSFTTT